INGDGLIDVVYPSSGALKVRLMERQGGTYGWGSERSVQFDMSTFGELECSPDAVDCGRAVEGAPITKTGFVHMADFNGDAAADLLIGESQWQTTGSGGRQCPFVRASAPAAR